MNDNDNKIIKENNKEIEKKVKKVNVLVNSIGLSIFIIICIIITILVIPYLKQFFHNPQAFRAVIKDNGFLGVVIFLLVQVLQIIVSIIPGEFVEVAAGITFGWFFGFLLCELGILIGTVIIFFVCKKFGRPIIDLYLGKGKLQKFEKLDKSSKRDKLLFILFFIPGIPKDILIYASAFFSISLKKFLVISLIARIPSIISSTIAGNYLIEKNYTASIIIFAISGLIAIIAYIFYDKIYKKIIENKKNK